MRELAPGLWQWTSVHPETDGTEWWPTTVSSFAVDDDDRLFVIDPVDPPGELGDLVAGREAAVVLTNPWHDRDARLLVEPRGIAHAR
jgi:hypothetical protein